MPRVSVDMASVSVRSAGAGRLTATSHESGESVRRVYPHAAAHVAELRARGAEVAHDVDGTSLAATLPPALAARAVSSGGGRGRYDRVVWHFPCIGRGLVAGADGQNAEMEANKELVRSFGASAAALLARPDSTIRSPGGGGGELHITHKTKPPYCHWELARQATARSGLQLRGSVVFDRASYPCVDQSPPAGAHAVCQRQRTRVLWVPRVRWLADPVSAEGEGQGYYLWRPPPWVTLRFSISIVRCLLCARRLSAISHWGGAPGGVLLCSAAAHAAWCVCAY